MKVKYFVLFVISIVMIWLSSASAGNVQIQGFASEIKDGDCQGCYTYYYGVFWYMDAGEELDYWELKLPCDLTEEAIFTEFLGSSNSVQNPYNFKAISWDGIFLESDPTLGISCPVLRFTPGGSDEDILQNGQGSFQVVSNLVPEVVSLEDVVILKYVDSTSPLLGDLRGFWYPTNNYVPDSANCVPEPAMVLLLGLGSSFMFIRRR